VEIHSLPLGKIIWTPKGIDLSKREVSQEAIDNVIAFFKRYTNEPSDMTEQEVNGPMHKTNKYNRYN
jgi:hypothetical protein